MDWGTAGHVDLAVKSPFTPNMPKKISDMAVEKVPSISNRFSLFQSKFQIAHYAQGSIIDYCHALYEAVVYQSKSPDDFTQADVDGYLQYLLSCKPMPAEAQFKHFVYGLKYFHVVFIIPDSLHPDSHVAPKAVLLLRVPCRMEHLAEVL